MDTIASSLEDPATGASPRADGSTDCLRYIHSSQACSDIKKKFQLATELRDEFDQWVQGGQLAPFLTRFVPIFLKQLEGPPSFITTSTEQVWEGGWKQWGTKTKRANAL